MLKQLGQKVYYLAQLHTTNAFGHGGGRTPSAQQIERTLSLARTLGVDGFGYYTKNAMPTVCTKESMQRGYWESPQGPPKRISTDGCNPDEDLRPLDPNLSGQQMVYQNSLGRWQFGISKLIEF